MAHPTRRALLAAAATSGAALALPRAGRAQGAGAAPVRVGCIATFSGAGAQNGILVRASAEIGAEYITQVNLLGRPLEIVFRDDKADPNLAVAAARELMSQGIRLFVGPFYSAAVLAIQGILPQERALLTSIAAIADPMTHESFNRYYFRVTDNSYMRFHAFARVMAEQYPDVLRWGAVFQDNATGHSQWSAFTDGLRHFYGAAGRTPAIQDAVLVKFNGTDYKNEIARLLSQGVEGLHIGTGAADSVTLFQQGRSFDLEKRMKVYAEAGTEFELQKTLKRNTPENMWAASHWYYGSYVGTNPIAKALYEAWLKRSNEPRPGGHLEPTFAALLAYAQAIKAAGSTDPDALIPALEGMSWDTAKGRRTYRAEDHQAICDVNLVRCNPISADPGWEVSSALVVSGAGVIEPPTPGKPLTYPPA